MKTTLRIVVLAMLAGLAGCSGIGDGSTLKSFQIGVGPRSALGDQGFLADDENVVMYECFCTNLDADTLFTDGTRTDFVNRVKWTVETGADVVKVYDGTGYEDFFADNTLCAGDQRVRGALIPLGPGTATIKAEFADVTDVITVTVREVLDGDITVRPSDALSRAFAPDEADEVAVPVGASVDLATYFTPSDADSDGREREVFGSNWQILKAGVANTEFITINSREGIMTGAKPDLGQPLVARTTFPACGVTLERTARSGDVISLALANEKDAEPLPDGTGLRTDTDDGKPLIVNTNEQLKITAGLDYGEDANDDVDAMQDLRRAPGVNVRELCSTITCTGTAGGTCGDPVDDQFCGNIPVCAAEPDPAVALCRTSAARFSTALVPMIVPLAFDDETTADGTVGDISYFVATFDPTPNLTTDDAPTLSDVPGCPELVCSPLSETPSENVRATPVAGTFKTLAIDQGPGPVAIGTEYGTTQLTATGTFNAAGTLTQKVTNLATVNAVSWSSADSSIAAVSNLVGTKGLVTALGCSGDDDTPGEADADGTEPASVVIRLRASGAAVSATAASASFTAEGNTACVTDPLCEDIVVQVMPAAVQPAYCD